MKVIDTAISDVQILQPRVFADSRGFFMESFRASWLDALNCPGLNFVQDNHSASHQGVLRGLHYQLARPQGKLVRVIAGEVFDVAVDLRRGSATFGQHVATVLSAENKQVFWVPPGFAHGFLVLSPQAEFVYKCSDYYNPGDEYSLLWNDPALGIDWPLTGEPELSDKDRSGLPLSETPLFD